MSGEHPRHRDAGTGEFVTDDYATQHPESTVAETRRPRPDREDTAAAHNLAIALTEQLGVPVRAVVDYDSTPPLVYVAITLDTAQTIYTEGRKLVAP